MSNFLIESVKSFFWGDPCPKHPGHRDRELDVEAVTSCAMMAPMCAICFEEMESETLVEKEASDIGIQDRFALLERCEQEAVCPTGCGPLIQKSYTLQECPVCGFRHFNASPERKPHATE